MSDAPEGADAGAPVTRREFDALVDAVRDLVAALDGHSHGYADPDSSYGSDTYGPDDGTTKTLRRLAKALDGLSGPEG